MVATTLKVSLSCPDGTHKAHNQKVIVTGGLGYIGSHVVIALLLTGKYIPIVIDNCHNAYPEAVKRCAEIARTEMG